MFLRALSILLGFAACLGLAAAAPSLVTLKNGDRVTGEVVREADGKVVVRTESLGELAVPRAAVEKIEALPQKQAQVAAVQPMKAGEAPAVTISPTSKPKAVPAPAQSPNVAAATSPKIAPAPSPASAPAAAPAAQAVAKAAPAQPPKKPWRQVWKETRGSMETSYNDQTGRHTSKNLTFRGDLDYNSGPDRYHLEGRYYYGKYDGYIHSDRRDTAFRWRHDLTKRFFSQATTSHTLDNVKLIDLNFEQNLGLGWAAVADKRQELSLVAGATGQSRRAFGKDTDTLALAELSQQYSLKINDRLTLRHDATAQYSTVSRSPYVVINGQLIPSDTEADNYRLRVNFSLQGKLTERISMTLRYEYEYDNIIQLANLKSDQRTSTSVGYHF